MTEVLEILIVEAQRMRMDERQLRERRLGFVCGNTHVENERITREMVAEADETVAREDRGATPDEKRG